MSDIDVILELEGINEKLCHTLNYLKKARLKIKDLRFLNMEKIQRIEKLKAENEKLRKAVEFYANQWTSWEGVNGRTIVSQDREITEENRPSGGKLARATLKEIDGE